MRSFLSSIGMLAAVGLVSLLIAPVHAQTTVDFATLGTFTQSGPISTGGIFVTSTGTFTLTSGLGLGIEGGSNRFPINPDLLIDFGESVLFTFTNGPATNVSVFRNQGASRGGSEATTLEAFGTDGSSLGVFTFLANTDAGFGSNPDLSSRVGGAAISAFRITGGDGSGANVSSITYTSTVSAVPEPGEYAVMGMAGLTVCGLMLRVRRRKKSANATMLSL